MISVLVNKQGNYPIKVKKVKDFLKVFFTDNGIVSDAYVSVAIVSERKMLAIGSKYLKDHKVHNVLSFNESEAKLSIPASESGKIYLGEIIVCYPKVFSEAVAEDKTIEDKLLELVEHSGWHLMGKHHEI